MTFIKDLSSTRVIMITDDENYLFGVEDGLVHVLDYKRGTAMYPVGMYLKPVEHKADALVQNGVPLLAIIRRERKRERDLIRKEMERQQRLAA